MLIATSMAKKSVLHVYSEEDWGRDQPWVARRVKETYRVWNPIMRERKIEQLAACIDWFSRGTFTKYWRCTANDTWERVDTPVKPTILFDRVRYHDPRTGDHLVEVYARKKYIAQYIEWVNHEDFTELIDNKLNQAALFYDYGPRSQLRLPGTVIKNPRGKKLVFKALDGMGGQFVDITTRKRTVIEQHKIQQEFIEASSHGRLQDVRIGFVGDKAEYVYSRVAKPGSFYTNVKAGAHMEWHKLSDVKALLKLSKEIVEPLRLFPKRYFTLDFMIAKTGKPYLIEANSTPGHNNFSEQLLYRLLSDLTDLMIPR
jgi:hypothetical protein